MNNKPYNPIELFPHGFGRAAICASLGIDERTERRWRKAGEAPAAVVLWLELLSGRRLDLLHPDWAGWGINRKTGEFWSPENTCWSPGRLRAYQYQSELLRVLQRKIDELEPVNVETAPDDKQILLFQRR